MSKSKWEFEGTSFAIPVTFNWSLFIHVTTFPIALSMLPKYFFAVVSVSTTLFGSFKTVAGLPLINGNEKRLKKSVSTSNTFFS